MKPGAFEYVRADSWDAAVRALAADDGASALAGGQSLVPAMNLRLASPTVLVDLQGIDGGAAVRREGDVVSAGALLTHARAATDAELREVNPIIADAAGAIGHPAIRSRGTLGGSLAHADPAAEWPLVVALLGAEVVVHGPDGERSVRGEDFVRHVFTPSLDPGEVVTEVRFRCSGRPRGGAYRKLARVHGDFALLGVGVVAERTEQDGRLQVRVGVTGLGPKALVWTGEDGCGTPALVADRAAPWFLRTGDLARSPELARHGERMLRALVARTAATCFERLASCG